ncbi:crossover junction endodeoxyribonuclease RuvC [Jannaschia aquimarina]|uniref:Crossover junction endodeoxyribonuclease RuvC n=1 Tax=Jannaschia aquimarina TaxID=935700 RepID=A0A0D1EL41_9RHOB|nr:crossover junction endodeoxyribonuclease RuvC [Jannaschia aquimarina]KIT16460.1 Crossover junction endodeoxyribonuclease RuvC [Jannaschia aquimarina]SNS92910.1 Holliday junction endonuclease RuvC [Jannaschia aquimarina]
MRVIGIDPGLNACGWGVVDVDGSRLSFVACGTVRPPRGDLSARLLALHSGLTEALTLHRPDAAAVEATFVNRDGAGTLKLGQARGVAMLAVAQAGLVPGEYAPNAVKKTVTGVGHAAKAQIDHMVKMQLPGCTPDSPDAADALAIALCHAFQSRLTGRLAAAIGVGR